MTKYVRLEQNPQILVINPGSTSTKVAIFSEKLLVRAQTIDHSSAELSLHKRVSGQIGLRIEAINRFLRDAADEIINITAIAGRGGLLRPLASGTYLIEGNMYTDLEKARFGEHASNLGALLALHFGKSMGVPAFVVDPVTVDEFDEPARETGVPGIKRKSRVHSLNIKSVARLCATELGKNLGSTSFVVAHMGGGISVCAMVSGQIIDSTDALLGEGPFSLERAGTVPLASMLDLCFDKGLSKQEVAVLLSNKSGFKGFFGIDRLPDVYRLIDEGNKQADVLLQAMVRQIVKWVGGMVVVMKTKPDAIILTGGMVHSTRFVASLMEYLNYFGIIKLYPGEREMEALAEGVFRVLNKKEVALHY